jgi:hypothetical protein
MRVAEALDTVRSTAGLYVVLAAIICSAGGANVDPADAAPVGEQHAHYATTCLRDGRPVSTSYRAADLGRNGTPALTTQQQALLHTIVRAVPSPALRVAFVGTARAMIIYDAPHGPCYGSVPGYRILNDDCNGYFLPTDGFTTALPEPCPPVPPWMTSPSARPSG